MPVAGHITQQTHSTVREPNRNVTGPMNPSIHRPTKPHTKNKDMWFGSVQSWPIFETTVSSFPCPTSLACTVTTTLGG